jgi:hypothetical protein
MLSTLEDYVGKYISDEWIRKKILRQSDEEIKEQDRLINAEKAAGDVDDIDLDI